MSTLAHFENTIPILNVRDLGLSIDYYTSKLGFEVDWHMEGVMGSVSRDRKPVMLCQGGQGQPGTWVWMGVSDVDALYTEYLESGAIIRVPPRNYSWSCEMHVEDIDGNTLRMGSECKEDQPLDEWID